MWVRLWEIFYCIYLAKAHVSYGEAMAPHSSTLAWKILWTEEPGGLQSMGSLGVGRDWATSLSLSCIGEGNANPLQYSCLENPRDGGAWWAAICGVTQSRTPLKRLSSSSSSSMCLMSKYCLNRVLHQDQRTACCCCCFSYLRGAEIPDPGPVNLKTHILHHAFCVSPS